MKLKDFKRKMQKDVFTTTEAHLVALQDQPRLLNLQLHQWMKSGEIIQLKRGLYMFADATRNIPEIAGTLYSPCYFSLEYALNFYNIIPEAVFGYTLVTPKPTRTFDTFSGRFYYHTIKKSAFTGFDPETLMAYKEKALVDYFYLNSSKLVTSDEFWRESRLEVKETEVNFTEVFKYAKLFGVKKLIYLLKSLENYAKSD